MFSYNTLNLPLLFPRKNKLEKKYYALDKISADLLELDEDEIRPVRENKSSMHNEKTRWDHSFRTNAKFPKKLTFRTPCHAKCVTGGEKY